MVRCITLAGLFAGQVFFIQQQHFLTSFVWICCTGLTNAYVPLLLGRRTKCNLFMTFSYAIPAAAFCHCAITGVVVQEHFIAAQDPSLRGKSELAGGCCCCRCYLKSRRKRRIFGWVLPKIKLNYSVPLCFL